MPDESYKYLGIVSLALIWAGLLYVIYQWPGNKSLSFSLHAAQKRGGQIFYFFLFFICMPLLYLFLIKWYIPTFQLGTIFTVFATIGVAGQLLAAAVPAVPVRRQIIHDIGAYATGLTLVPMTVMIALANISLVARIVCVLVIGYMLGALIVFFMSKRSHNYYLYFQGLYFASFHIVLLTSAYIR